MVSQSVTVGLAVGIPSAVIIAFVLVLWVRNQRKQRKEDSLENEYDLGLRDDHSFDQFQSELHRPYNTHGNVIGDDPNKSSSTAVATEIAEKPYISSNGSSTSTTTIDHPPHSSNNSNIIKPASLNRSPAKHASAYDFYDAFIPVLPPNSSHHDTTHETESTTDSPAHSIAATNNHPVAGTPRDSSLDNLAKQLTGPAFFEKLPSRAATVTLKHRFTPPHGPNHVMSTNNSSSDLVGFNLGEKSTINDNFVYEAPTLDVAAENLHQSHQNQKGIAGALGGNIDNSFDKDARLTENAASPFLDASVPRVSEESEPQVVFQ